MAGKYKKIYASGVRPGGEDMRATNVPVGNSQRPVRGHPEEVTGDACGVRPGVTRLG